MTDRPARCCLQDEYFTVVKGYAGFLMDGKEGFVREGSGEVHAPVGHAHTFFNADTSQDLEVQASGGFP